ncbi:hypothetical protein [Kribbella sp. NPDC055071]
MTHNYTVVPRHHWLVRYYRAQLRFYLRVLTALRLVPPPIAVAGYAWLRRTEIPKRGTKVKSSIRSKIVVPVLVVLGVVVLIVMLVARWQRPDGGAGTPSSGGTVVPGETAVQLKAWRRPVTSDPREFAVAYARAIWTYDTTRHSYVDWQNAVSVFADPTSAAPEVARSLLPLWSEWDQLSLHKARATVGEVGAEVTPQLQAMASNASAPKGWHAFVVTANQTTILDTETKFVQRQAAVAVVCTPLCKFWSATAQVSP